MGVAHTPPASHSRPGGKDVSGRRSESPPSTEKSAACVTSAGRTSMPGVLRLAKRSTPGLEGRAAD